jgi:hypothetical protein
MTGSCLDGRPIVRAIPGCAASASPPESTETAMIRVAILAVLIGLMSAAHAFAQVAATDLVPAAPVFIHPDATAFNGTNITPDNPAALAWGGTPRIAVGKLKGSVKDNLGVSPTTDIEGTFGGFRFVGDTFGIAAESSSVDLKTTPNVNADKSSDVQLSLAFGNGLALGIGAGHSKGETTSDDISMKEAGVSLRLGSIFYVGVGARQDENRPVGKTSVYTGLPVSAKRHVTMGGVAIRTEGDVRYYLALETIRAKSFDFTADGGPTEGGFDLNRISAQGVWYSFLLGATFGDLDVKDYGGGKPSVKLKTFDIGFAPIHDSLSLTLRRQETNVTDNNPSDVTVSTTSLAVAVLF